MTASSSGRRDAALLRGARHSRFRGDRLGAAFFDRSATDVARDLLGTVLVHRTPEGVVAGRIVETEAYLGRDDPASHAFRGPRPHCRALFGPPGTVYVYRSYGIHWCVNVVTAPAAHGCAVLLRAVEPLEGLALMRRWRNAVRDTALASGPGRLGQAFGCSMAQDGTSWIRGPLAIHHGTPLDADAIAVTPRIGITKAAEAPLRFVHRGSPHASRPRATRPLPHARAAVKLGR